MFSKCCPQSLSPVFPSLLDLVMLSPHVINVLVSLGFVSVQILREADYVYLYTAILPFIFVAPRIKSLNNAS